jgi:hypothetical protein
MLGSRSRRCGVKVGDWRDVICEGWSLRYGGRTVGCGSGGIASYALHGARVVSTVANARRADRTHSCTCASSGAVATLLYDVLGVILLAKIDRVKADGFVN